MRLTLNQSIKLLITERENFRLCSSSQKKSDRIDFFIIVQKNNVLFEFIQLQYQTQKIISREEHPGSYSLHLFHTLQAKR